MTCNEMNVKLMHKTYRTHIAEFDQSHVRFRPSD